MKSFITCSTALILLTITMAGCGSHQSRPNKVKQPNIALLDIDEVEAPAADDGEVGEEDRAHLDETVLSPKGVIELEVDLQRTDVRVVVEFTWEEEFPRGFEVIAPVNFVEVDFDGDHLVVRQKEWITFRCGCRNPRIVEGFLEVEAPDGPQGEVTYDFDDDPAAATEIRIRINTNSLPYVIKVG